MATSAQRWNDSVKLLHRVRAEYHKMPGLRLTAAQARRVWNMDDRQCAVVLGARRGWIPAENRAGFYVRDFPEVAVSARRLRDSVPVKTG